MLLIEDRLEAARSHLAAGRADSAALLLESVLDMNPANVPALKELASIKLRGGDIKKAHVLAGEAAARAASDPDVLCLLAKTALVSEQEDQAAAALDQALAVDPFHPEANRLRATMLAWEAKPRAAEGLLQEALEKHPANPDLLAALSEVYMQYGLAAPALEFSQKALALSPDRPDILALVGTQLAELGSHENAIGFLERAHLLEPGNALFLIRLADAQAATGELSAAHRTAKRAVGLFPDLLSAWASYAKVMIYRGQAQAGLAEFVPVTKRNPDKTAALLTLAATYRIAGEPAQALRLVEPIVRQLATLKPSQKTHLMALVRDCCLSLGMFDQVAATFPGFDFRAALGLPAKPHANGAVEPAPDAAAGLARTEPDVELAAVLKETSLLIDGPLSILESIALLRFRLGRLEDGHVADIQGPASLEQVVALMENTSFTATDVPRIEGSTERKRVFPLSHALALPTTIRGAIADQLPYMRATEARREIWRRSLAEFPRPLVALAWDSSRPGILLEDYRPVLSRFHGTLISVIWDDSRGQLTSWPEIIDAGVHFSSLDDLAAVIAETDAIVGPDGVPLHVAGAMARRGALLSLPSPPWYWYDEQGTSAWYPSISVLKSGSFGNWQEKLPELGESIETLLSGLARTANPPSQAEDPHPSNSKLLTGGE